MQANKKNKLCIGGCLMLIGLTAAVAQESSDSAVDTSEMTAQQQQAETGVNDAQANVTNELSEYTGEAESQQNEVDDVQEAARQQFYELQNTLRGVLNQLVEQGVLSQEQVETIVTQSTDEARSQIEDETAPRQVIIDEAPLAPTEKVIRVPYVPEYAKQQMRDEIRNGLREDTINAVMSQAKMERWGVPGSTPEWINRIKWKGDVRLRAQSDDYDSSNPVRTYPDWIAINDAGGISADNIDNAYLNTTEDRTRLRLRARLGMDAEVTNDVKAGFRLATGSLDDPVSTNKTLGNYANRYQMVLDRAYLRYKHINADRYNNLVLWGGRMPNPWESTDLVWDSDLAFEGIAAKYRFNIRGSGDLFDMVSDDRTLFFTLGAFPLAEFELEKDDKWLYGAQLGYEWVSGNQSTGVIAISYYNYDNIVGQLNAEDSNLNDFTAPDFVQKGNTMFDIRVDDDDLSGLYALASDFKIIDVTARYDFSNFSPYRLSVILDYAKNIGFDEEEILLRTGEVVEERSEAYQAKIIFGWPYVTWPGNWRAHLAYKRLERDSVLDAFTDSDFHLGGTDAKGYIVGGDYGLLENVWLSVRYLSSDAVDGAPYAIDTVQIDLNAVF